MNVDAVGMKEQAPASWDSWTAIERDEIDPTFVITHRYNLSDAARQDECVKVILKP